jgi:2-phosphoglycolate phosphatase
MAASLPGAPRAVLFDLDGTLADTAPDLAAAANKLRTDRGLDAIPYERLRPVASHGARGLVGVAFGLAPGEPGFEELRTEFLANYESALVVHSRLFDGVPELLEQLRERGIAWGVVTNKHDRYTQPLIPLIGLGHAACVIAGDTTPHAKPHPEPLFEAARRIGRAPAECWYVGDDLRDMQAAQAAGMVSIAAGWGYCGDSDPVTWQADHITGRPGELLELIVKVS